MNRGARGAKVHGVTELDVTEEMSTWLPYSVMPVSTRVHAKSL